MHVQTTINYQHIDDCYRQKLRGLVLSGGSRCFDATQKIVTSNGSKDISSIEIGEVVKTYNEKTKEIEFKNVINTFKMKNDKRCVEIKLKSGEIIRCTEDHKFFFNKRWYEAKTLLSLLKPKTQ